MTLLEPEVWTSGGFNPADYSPGGGFSMSQGSPAPGKQQRVVPPAQFSGDSLYLEQRDHQNLTPATCKQLALSESKDGQKFLLDGKELNTVGRTPDLSEFSLHFVQPGQGSGFC